MRTLTERKLPVALAVVGLIGFAAGHASAAKLSQQDRTFMRQAAQGGLGEVQAGQLAQERGDSQAVKQLGQTLVTDHTRMNDQLMQIAQQHGVTLPRTTDSKDRSDAQALQKLSGPQFDRQFAQGQVQDHRTMIQKLQTEERTTKDPSLRQWAQAGIPVMQQHLQMAQQAATGTS